MSGQEFFEKIKDEPWGNMARVTYADYLREQKGDNPLSNFINLAEQLRVFSIGDAARVPLQVQLTVEWYRMNAQERETCLRQVYPCLHEESDVSTRFTLYKENHILGLDMNASIAALQKSILPVCRQRTNISTDFLIEDIFSPCRFPDNPNHTSHPLGVPHPANRKVKVASLNNAGYVSDLIRFAQSAVLPVYLSIRNLQDLTLENMQAVLNTRLLKNVEVLDASDQRNSNFVHALLNSPYAEKLKILKLQNVNMGSLGLNELQSHRRSAHTLASIASASLPNLELLDISSHEIRRDPFNRPQEACPNTFRTGELLDFANDAALPKLRVLVLPPAQTYLEGNVLDEEIVHAFIANNNLPALEVVVSGDRVIDICKSRATSAITEITPNRNEHPGPS